jgi:8-amino-7-oxononanoate synthase
VAHCEQSGWEAWVDGELGRVRAAGRWRQVRALEGTGPHLVDGDGVHLVSFASNDYLGLAAHPAVTAAAAEAAVRAGAGSGSSRLIVGDRPVHHELEAALAGWRRTESALVFPTGYQANLAVLTSLGAPGCRIVSDELNHASIIDGARLARADVAVFRHGDVEHAEHLVRSWPGRAVVVTDSVFSMDGDVAPLAELSAVCARAGALLVVDDAHAVFDLPPVDGEAVCLRVGTLSKALGSQGGFVAAGRRWIDLLVNRGRSFIFTTGLAPAAAAAALAAVEVCRGPEGRVLVGRLRHLVDRIAPGHPSPVIPVILGSEEAALDAAAALGRLGLLVPAIRPPTVPPGTSRLRVSVSAAHSDEEVDRLVSAMAAVGRG